ncbi:DNA-binding protein [Acinetobacter johnsonii]|uniref:DNA-binding protein n=1 Tax=Acinetobacter johnsonii TaxID=40214 RepID=A0AA42LEB3_ACIJO|nr:MULTISPECIES: DNA-binding protein [Acinetobacter]MBV7307338.1 DNA-binding protein [Acinetobacter sp. CWB-G5]MDH0655919.1 DNA-binding protein [Acinetobacter johnsonii]
MPEFVVTIDADSAPQIVLGQKLFGGTVTALKLEKRKLVSVAELVSKYGFSDETIRNKLAVINQGTNGKHMYDPEAADALLKKQTRRRGPKRIN